MNRAIRGGLAGLALALASVATGAMAIPASAQAAPKIRTLSEQEVIDLMVGTGIQATRASDTEGLIRQAKALLAEGRQFRMIEPADMPDDWTVVMAGGGIGGGDAWQYVVDRIAKQAPPTIPNPTLAAMKALEHHVGKTFKAVIRNEAAQASLMAFATASAAGLPVVDACPAGRAKPDVQLSLPFINGLSVTPAALVTKWGDTVIIDKTIDDFRYEDMGRALAVASGGGIAQARGVMTGAEVKRATDLGAVSEAILFGRTVREAVLKKQDPIKALLKVSNGYPLFRGKVTSAKRSGERGFSWWDVELAGTGAYAGHVYRVWVKNENMFSWLDGKPDVAAPDLIYNLDPATGWATNANDMGYTLGSEVYLIGRVAPSPAWRSAKGLDLTDPKRFGFDFAYRPIEEVWKTRPAFKG